MFLRKPARRATAPIFTLWNWLLTIGSYFLLIVVMINVGEFRLLSQLNGGVSVFERPLLLLVVVVVILFLSGVVHELGHLLAGLLVQFHFQLLVMGPFRLQRKRNGIRLGWRWSSSLFSGLTACLPLNDHNLRWRMLAFAAGGPVASLLMGVGSAFVFFGYRRDFDFLRGAGWVVEVAVLTAVASFIFFLTSMKPGLYHAGFPADGGRIASLLRGDKLAERWSMLALLNGADALGVRPRDWDSALVYKAMTLADGTYDDLSARIMGYQWALDNGRTQMAKRLLDEAMENWAAWMSGARVNLTLEKAYFLAYHQGNAHEARTWFERVGKGRGGKRPLQHRAKAAVFLAEGNYQGAHAQAMNGLATLRKEPLTGITLAETDWLREIRQKAQKP